tara:strand:- start:686 stop:1039 length:354 start_codon:yes stop_codon:yes gene_type:complete
MKNLLLTAAMFITFAVNAQKSLLEGVWKNTDNATTYLTVITVDDSEKVTNIYSFSFSTNKEILEEIMGQDNGSVISMHYVKRTDYSVTSRLVPIDEFTMKREIQGDLNKTIIYKKII